MNLTGYRARCVPRTAGLDTRRADSTTRSVVVRKLRNGTVYDCQVRAANSVGFGPWSPKVAVRPVGPPSAPRSLSASPGPRRAHLSWSRPANNGGFPITGYRARCVPRNSDLATVATSSTTRTATLTGMRKGARYDCQVRARNQLGLGKWSAKATVRPTG
jgi:hypothetical protein